MSRLTTWIDPVEDAVPAVLGFIKSAYEKDDDGLELTNKLDRLFDDLKEDLYTLMEYPYV
jgi:hypothetical protein